MDVAFWNSEKLDLGPVHVFPEKTVSQAEGVTTSPAESAVATGDHGVDEDAVAGLEAGGPGPEGGHLAAGVRTQDAGQGDLESRHPAAEEEVQMVEGGGPDPDQDLAGLGGGGGDLLDLQDLGASVGMDADGAHEDGGF